MDNSKSSFSPLSALLLDTDRPAGLASASPPPPEPFPHLGYVHFGGASLGPQGFPRQRNGFMILAFLAYWKVHGVGVRVVISLLTLVDLLRERSQKLSLLLGTPFSQLWWHPSIPVLSDAFFGLCWLLLSHLTAKCSSAAVSPRPWALITFLIYTLQPAQFQGLSSHSKVMTDPGGVGRYSVHKSLKVPRNHLPSPTQSSLILQKKDTPCKTWLCPGCCKHPQGTKKRHSRKSWFAGMLKKENKSFTS